jgi:UDP-N-acetylmuramate dehydrogenase
LFDTTKILSALPEDLKELVHRNHPLGRQTSLQIGGPAALLCHARNTDHCRRFQEIALAHDLPFFILGEGSNILAADEGFPGLVLRVATEEFTPRGETLVAGAGLNFDDLIRRSLSEGLQGLEFASGIPGTLGGAIMGNAGCYGHEICDYLIEAITLGTDGTIRHRGPEDFGFSYRSTTLRESGEILLQATLGLKKGNLDQAWALREEKILDRQGKHPQNLPSAGSWFRNLPAPSAGQRRVAAGSLLEQAGAKEMSEGDARVYEKHANIIVNDGHATCAEVRRLAGRMKNAVRDQFQVELIEEVRYLGPPEA